MIDPITTNVEEELKSVYALAIKGIYNTIILVSTGIAKESGIGKSAIKEEILHLSVLSSYHD